MFYVFKTFLFLDKKDHKIFDCPMGWGGGGRGAGEDGVTKILSGYLIFPMTPLI